MTTQPPVDFTDPSRKCRAAVLGDPISHSLSPTLHNAGYRALGLANWSYDAIRCPEGTLASTIASLPDDYAGYSVTMPGKFEALDFADEASTRATLIGSANTLVKKWRDDRSTYWYADNTDGDGLVGAINDLAGGESSSCEGTSGHAVIIGNGGTARPAVWAVAEQGFTDLTVVARSDRAESLRDLAQTCGLSFQWIHFDDAVSTYAEADLLISTVPSQAVSPWAESISQAKAVVDVIYNPWPTQLLLACLDRGTPCVGGLTMLYYQALSQFEQFTRHSAPAVDMRTALESETGIELGRLN